MSMIPFSNRQARPQGGNLQHYLPTKAGSHDSVVTQIGIMLRAMSLSPIAFLLSLPSIQRRIRYVSLLRLYSSETTARRKSKNPRDRSSTRPGLVLSEPLSSALDLRTREQRTCVF